MSTLVSTAPGAPARTPAATDRQGKPKRCRHTPGGATLGRDASRQAHQMAAAILEVLAGQRTPAQAAEALGVSLPRYFQVETRALHALVASCEPRPRGPGRQPERELAALQREHERLQRELARQQALVRMAQRSLGLAPPPAPPKPTAGKTASKRKRRRPVVRALHAAQQLQRQSQEAPPATPEVQENP